MDSTVKGRVMRVWIWIAIVMVGCSSKSKECPECPKTEIGIRDINGVRVLRIQNTDGHITYMRIDATWDCDQGETSCRKLAKDSVLRRGTPVCPCEDKDCQPWCHPFPKNPRDLEMRLPHVFDVDPLPPGVEHRPDAPAPPLPADAAVGSGSN
jgi:hypothetical protein